MSHVATLPSPRFEGWIGAYPPLLADFECAHGRLPTDRTPPCGCWHEESPKPPTAEHLRRREERRRPATERSSSCAHCGGPLTQPAVGRPRVTCSTECRLARHRGKPAVVASEQLVIA